MKFTSVDLNTVVAEALENFELMIEEKRADFVIGKLPVIEGDQGMMEQLFENLISNSLKYSKDQEDPKIKIACATNSNSVELIFEDNGIGFDEQYLPQMFTLFQRLHNRSKYEGTGLGLAICKKIVDMHSGRIWAHSKEGTGATFHISLPINTSTA